MLPFLSSKIRNGAMVSSSPNKSNIEMNPEESMDDSIKELEYAAQDVLRAMEIKSAIELASALKSFYDICESYEGDGEEMEGYAQGGMAGSMCGKI